MPKKIVQVIGEFVRIRWRSRDTPEGEVPFLIGEMRSDEFGRVGFKCNADPAEFIPCQVYRFQGYAENHPKFGKTIDVRSWTVEEPHSRRGLTIYLQRNCEGIGAKRASDLWDAFGVKAVEVCRTDPSKAHGALGGIVPLEVMKSNARKLESIKETEHVRIELVDLLSGRGFRQVAIDQCIAKWKLNAPDAIKANPYILMQQGIAGAGFLRCDGLYLELGHDPAAMVRQIYALHYALKSDTGGNSWIHWIQCRTMLNSMISSVDVDGREALKSAVDLGLVVYRKETDGLWVSEKKRADNERVLCASIRGMLV